MVVTAAFLCVVFCFVCALAKPNDPKNRIRARMIFFIVFLDLEHKIRGFQITLFRVSGQKCVNKN